MMATPFNRLPPEMLCAVCAHLDADSIGQVRRVSRGCKVQFTPFFLHYFRTQDIDLSPRSLQRLSDMASSPDLCGAVRVLNLTCLYHQEAAISSRGPNTYSYRARGPPDVAQHQPDQAHFSGNAMCDALTTLLRRLSNIDTITLEGAVICYTREQPLSEHRCNTENVRGLSWLGLWAHAIRASRVVLSAVARSQPGLKSLFIYQKTVRCGLPTNQITADLIDRMEAEGFEVVGRGLQHLAISVGTTVLPPPASSTEDTPSTSRGFYELVDLIGGDKLEVGDPRLDAHAGLDGLTRLLRFMPNLESLDLHLFNAAPIRSTVPEDRPFQSLLPTLFTSLSLARLESLSLRGLPATEQTLTGFLSQHPRLRSLALDDVYLSGGSWTKVLAVAVRACPGLSRAQLCNLWQPEGLGPLHLESRCLRARKFDAKDPDVRGCWFGPVRKEFVWFQRVFSKGDIWELANVPSEPTYGFRDTCWQTGNTHMWVMKTHFEILLR